MVIFELLLGAQWLLMKSLLSIAFVYWLNATRRHAEYNSAPNSSVLLCTPSSAANHSLIAQRSSPAGSLLYGGRDARAPGVPAVLSIAAGVELWG